MNNEGADQLALPHRLIRAFVVRLLESIISAFATREISILLLLSVAEQASLGMTGFLRTRPINWPANEKIKRITQI